MLTIGSVAHGDGAKAQTAFQEIRRKLPNEAVTTAIVVDVADQKVYLFLDAKLAFTYPCSTSEVGVGSAENSNRTPLGLHRIKTKIGAGSPIGTVFRSRAPTKQIAKLIYEPKKGKGDLVTTRIMWLEGLEDGLNRGKGVDSYARYIYLHGTPEEGLIGKPASHGCIRMRNTHVVHLFEQVAVGTPVMIVE